MGTTQERLVEIKNQDGTFRGLLDHRDGRVYDRSHKLIETMSLNEDQDFLLSDYANELDCSQRARDCGRAVKMSTRDASERLVTMDLAVGDVHVDAIGPQFMGGYQLNDTVADLIAPVVVTNKASNKYPVWDAANAFRRVIPTGNAPGGQVAEVSPTLSTNAYQTIEYAISTFVTTEVESNADAPLVPFQAAIKRLMDALKLEREYRVATLLQTSGSWDSNVVTTVAAGNKWNGGAGSDPLGDLQLILQKSNMPVTRILWSELLDQTFSKNPNVQNKIYAKGNLAPIPSGNDFAAALHLPPIVVSRMKYYASGSAASYVWGNHPVLLHEAPSVGYDDVATIKTFRWTGNPATPDGQLQSGGWLFRSFFDNRRGGRGGTMGVLVHNDIEVMTSKLVGGLVINAYQ